MSSFSGHRDSQQTPDDQPSQEEANDRGTDDDLPLSPLDDRTKDLRQWGFEWGNGANLLEPKSNLFFLGRDLVQVLSVSGGDAGRPRNGSVARISVDVFPLRASPIIAARVWPLRVVIRIDVFTLEITGL